MDTVFLSFGTTEKFSQSVKRIRDEALTSGFFTRVHVLTENDLEEEFWNSHKTFIDTNIGFGYFVWKGWILWKTLETLKDGDILVYADSGCTLSPQGSQRFNEYLNELKTACVVGFHYLENVSPNCGGTDNMWTKMDLLHLFDESFGASGQIGATCILLRKSNETLSLAKKWYELSCNYHNIDDSPSIKPNHSSFIAHRHDQSIFSLVCKELEYNSPGSVVLHDYMLELQSFQPSFPFWGTRIRR